MSEEQLHEKYSTWLQQRQGLEVRLRGEVLTLLPERALWWASEGVLVVSDVHLGKAAHFRKAGIAVPEAVHMADFVRLELLLALLPVRHVIFLGDLFHSRANASWWEFVEWMQGHCPGVAFHLVRGNHDILPPAFYQTTPMALHNETLDWGPFCFSHEPLNSLPDVPGQRGKVEKAEKLSEAAKPSELNALEKEATGYNIAGHLHPAVRMRGRGRQGLTLPCFFFSEQGGLLPAFGQFTGSATISSKKSDAVYVVAHSKVIRV